jgi:hypothetical protein
MAIAMLGDQPGTATRKKKAAALLAQCKPAVTATLPVLNHR